MKHHLPTSITVIFFTALFLQAEASDQTTPKARHKPVVFALAKNPIDADHRLVDETSQASFAKEVGKRKLKLKEFRTFDFIYPESLLGIEDAIKQARLLDEAAGLLKDGKRVLHVADLSPEAQETVRGMFVALPGPAITVAAAQQPDLRLMAGLHTTVTAHFGDKKATYFMLPDASLPQWKDAMNPPPSQGSSGQAGSEREPAERQKIACRLPSATPFLAFVFTSTSSQLERLQFLGETQSFLRDECMAAKQRFDGAAKKAMASVYKDFAGRYDKLKNLDGNPNFQDLSAEDQRQCGQYFGLTRDRDLFPDYSDAMNFLNFAKTDSFRTEFALSLMIPQGVGANDTTIPISCPVHP